MANFPSDLAEAFPNGEYAEYFRQDWVTAMAKDVRANREFQPRTQETARWAREQIKRQVGMYELYKPSITLIPQSCHAL